MSLLPPIVTELVSFGCDAYPRAARRWPEHLHAFHQLDAVLGGEVFLEVEGRSPFRLRRGDAVLTPPMIRHAHRTRTGFRVGMFKFHAAPRYWTMLGARALQVRLPPFALCAIESAGAAWKARASLHEQQAAAALTLALAEAARSVRPAKEPADSSAADGFRSRLWRVLERVESNPYRPWTVAALAAECHFTPDHFTRRFRETLGHPPLEYLLRARIRAAAHELASDPELPIKEVAAASGYATVHAFTRAFRRVAGDSPARFRRSPGEL